MAPHISAFVLEYPWPELLTRNLKALRPQRNYAKRKEARNGVFTQSFCDQAKSLVSYVRLDRGKNLLLSSILESSITASFLGHLW